MKTLVIGARGQLGTDLTSVLTNEVVGLDHSQIEITDCESVQTTFENHQPDCVINAAAWNKVDLAEDEPAAAFAVNALGTRNLAVECERRGIVFVHVSTDYVFGGDTSASQPLTETSPPAPLSAYGVSKLAGEYFARSGCSKHFVLRTCGLYGIAGRSPGKGNFVETMLRLGRERDQLNVVDDQHCTPTSSMELARIIRDLIHTDQFGLYHAVNSNHCTWCEFASEIFRLANIDVKVTPIPSSEYPMKATRPPYSVLNNRKLTKVLNRPIPTWQQSLAEYISTELETSDTPKT